MYIIEDSAGNEAGRWKNTTNQEWPTGQTFSGRLKAGDQDPTGEYTVKAVIPKIEGEGPRTLSIGQPVKVGAEWHRITTKGAALPPPPDPVPGDEEYDHRALRRREYIKRLGEAPNFVETTGDVFDAVIKKIRLLESEILKAIPAAVTAEPDFDTIAGQIDQIKRDIPKP
jgi:hypothetical protein|tara:strand:- start:3126 stop:3635 length:510 start_codon:yes stop_codon:yes gene_type:complete